MASATTKLELRIDLGPRIVGEVPTKNGKKKKNPYSVKQNRTDEKLSRSISRGNSAVMPDKVEEDSPDVKRGEEEDAKRSKKKSRRSRHAKKAEKEQKNTEPSSGNADRNHTEEDAHPKSADKARKPILRTKDTPPSRSKVMIKESNKKMDEGRRNRTTPAITINTPLRGHPDSPLKPYKFRAAAPAIRGSLISATTPGTAKSEERKPLDVQAGMKALQQLIDAIGVGTRMLEFKEMLKAKVVVGMGGHVARPLLEQLNTFEKIIEELSVLWKINRVDLDLLEHLLNEIGMLERFTPDIEKYKSTVGYSSLPASSEREVTTIISSLHNLLQGSEESSGIYTTLCFLHYGDVYSFTRAKLSCMKAELSSLLNLHRTQLVYIAKVAADSRGYVTLFQMPCSISKKIVLYARKNHDILMSLGLKGIQVTGSDGLRYTQSMSYLLEKIPVGTQTSEDDNQIQSRNARTAPTLSLLPPLGQRLKNLTSGTGLKTRELSAQKPRTPHTELPYVSRPDVVPTPSPRKIDLSFAPQVDPDEAKFERRVNLLKSTLDRISNHQSEELVTVLLDQIQNLHRKIASLKKDLKEKTRELNSSQGFINKAEKEMKIMEMRLETKAHQISDTNDQLLKRIKKLMAENIRLKESLEQVCAEIDIHRQLEKENRFGNSVRAVRIGRLQTAAV
ncbi:unnamed protein product [Clavelina lepadiformis]|uniref:Uncharacterized protein n=2 Tax=Clavelina lepadiformis TaxID=159417 RepID=A0ABP0GWL5_CLALP